MNGVVERMRELVYEKERTIEAQSKLIEELRGLLQRADKHVVWESIGFSRDFQDEIESALSKANPHSEKVE